ncbi:MAG: 50S ribosomal protein L16 [Candidatus Aureabacteria bacterium]|nr:50S ribosomal protein L16 [Candidatus Auribacterota bacterium]
MALMPKKTTYRTSQRDRIKGVATRGNHVSFGEYGLQALEECWLKGIQIEAARVAINRFIKKYGKVWIRVFPDKPISKKPPETRQGKGKGNVEFWASVIKPGKILFELEGVNLTTAKEAFRRASAKLPIRVRLITRHY